MHGDHDKMADVGFEQFHDNTDDEEDNPPFQNKTEISPNWDETARDLAQTGKTSHTGGIWSQNQETPFRKTRISEESAEEREDTAGAKRGDEGHWGDQSANLRLIETSDSAELEKPKRRCLEGAWDEMRKKVSKEKRQIFNDGSVWPRNRVSNEVNNCKYNLWLLLPHFLWEQYQYFMNLYFLLLAVTQFFDRLKVGFMITYVGPLLVILGFSLLKELWDHYNTWKKDSEFNKETFEVWRKGKWKSCPAKDIRAGDKLCLKKGQRVPADLVYLGRLRKTKKRQNVGESMEEMGDEPQMSYTNIEEGSHMWDQDTANSDQDVTFVRTDQLDGESDLKPREPILFTQKWLHSGMRELERNIWKLVIEAPQDKIYSFQGGAIYKGGAESLKLKNSMWMGMTVSSSGVVGMVVFAGRETRMALNSRKKRSKVGQTDLEINHYTKLLFCLLLVFSVAMTVVSGQKLNWATFFYGLRVLVLLSSIIPISMRVMVDFAKIYYCLEINRDKELPGTVTRNSSLPEELGRVEYLLSDKTGTLTRNVMNFKVFVTRQAEIGSDHFDSLKRYLRGQPVDIVSQRNLASVNEMGQGSFGNLERSRTGSQLISNSESKISLSQRRVRMPSFFQLLEDGLEDNSRVFSTEHLGAGKVSMKENLEQRVLAFLLCNSVQVVKVEEKEDHDGDSSFGMC